ncbi:putative ABC transport system ATP-binding protein [Marinobacter persicus]|uniref:Putative ABC transport system ATP-binding protein n=1 Tax=Marinobacter persicus TaxID=930118 RepID=A0A1I3R0U4_9GAMM|nr:ATP-binding cassette domain-containing protein [Marinobacter persicus]GHD43332.1 ABC transporter ATP-binding protein [Marinobacter persicus]SFJ39660.1 putative ABC transport system ATP-binding protein [Marinobacter persicus]
MTEKTAATPAGSAGTDNAIHTRALAYRWPGMDTAMVFPDIQLARGEHLFLHGPSGTGKSTLLGLLSGLLVPERGTVQLLGETVSDWPNGARDRFRADHLGIIFQQFNLVPYLTASGNAELPCRLSSSRHKRAGPGVSTVARSLLAQLGLDDDTAHRKVTGLSIGQQQRVAAARALIGAPEIILADEPTSALDTDNRDRFLELLLTMAAEQGTSVVFVSHDQALARHFHDHIALEGRS